MKAIQYSKESDIPCKNNVNTAEKNLNLTESQRGSVQEVVQEKQPQEQENKAQKQNTNANTAEKSSWSTNLTEESIALLNALDLPAEKIVRFVMSAGNLCDKCAIHIVQEVAEVKTWDSSKEGSQVIQDFIGDYRRCTLIQNLVQCAENLASIDTTPTTTNLLRLFGSVNLVITNYIQETEKTAPKRFLYTPKASRKERNAGLEGMAEKVGGGMKGTEDQTLLTGSGNIRNNKMQNHHPTVKPISLMRYLCRLITPPNGTVLDPFTGSGTTGCACVLEGFDFIGIEQSEEYLEIAERRIEHWREDGNN